MPATIEKKYLVINANKSFFRETKHWSKKLPCILHDLVIECYMCSINIKTLDSDRLSNDKLTKFECYLSKLDIQ